MVAVLAVGVPNFTDLIFVLKGLIWLFIAMVFEITPTVRLYILLSPAISLISIL